MVQEDSLTMKYKLQSDVDHLMMSQILYKDSVFILAIKRKPNSWAFLTKCTRNTLIM